MLSYSVPSGEQGQNEKGKIKGLHKEGSSKDLSAPQGILCTKSMGRSTVQGQWKEQQDSIRREVLKT